MTRAMFSQPMKALLPVRNRPAREGEKKARRAERGVSPLPLREGIKGEGWLRVEIKGQEF